MEVLSTLEQDIQQTLSLSKQVLDAGQLVVVPSETVFGLAGCIYSRKAINSIFKVKCRPADNPLITHIHHIKQIQELAYIDRKREEILLLLYEQFWPGPLTIILPKREESTSGVNFAAYNMSTVAIRMPSHPTFKRLLEYIGYPLAAPSANISGRPSGTTVDDIIHSLQDQEVPYILDAQPSTIGIESTVLDISGDFPTILRPGATTQEALEDILKQSIPYTSATDNQKPRSPGQKYQHYQPRFPVYLFDDVASSSFEKDNQQYFIVHTELLVEALNCYGNVLYYPKEENLVHDLYHLLYRLEKQHCSVLWIEIYANQGLGRALMERLTRMSTSGSAVIQTTVSPIDHKRH